MAIWYLKRGDTGVTFRAVLKNPDDSVHDLSTATGGSPSAVNLWVWLSDGTKLAKRGMSIEGDGTAGAVTWKWVAADWVDELVVSPTLTPAIRDHRLEYEVLRPSSPTRLTFPNNGYDTLHILADAGDG